MVPSPATQAQGDSEHYQQLLGALNADLMIDCYPTRTNCRNKPDQDGAQFISKSLIIQNKLFLPFQSMEENGKALSRLLLEVIGDLQQCQKIWNKFFIK